MSFTNLRKIPSPEEIIAMTPLDEHLQKIKAERDADFFQCSSFHCDNEKGCIARNAGAGGSLQTD